MDGLERYADNLFVERLWRSLKYEEVYLKAYQDASEARAEIGKYIRFYNYLGGAGGIRTRYLPDVIGTFSHC